jgi:hypothetical protein
VGIKAERDKCILLEEIGCIKIHKNYAILDAIRVDKSRENM